MRGLGPGPAAGPAAGEERQSGGGFRRRPVAGGNSPAGRALAGRTGRRGLGGAATTVRVTVRVTAAARRPPESSGPRREEGRAPPRGRMRTGRRTAVDSRVARHVRSRSESRPTATGGGGQSALSILTTDRSTIAGSGIGSTRRAGALRRRSLGGLRIVVRNEQSTSPHDTVVQLKEAEGWDTCLSALGDPTSGCWGSCESVPAACTFRS